MSIFRDLRVLFNSSNYHRKYAVPSKSLKDMETEVKMDDLPQEIQKELKSQTQHG